MKHHITRSCNRLVQVVVLCETASWFYGFCEIGQFAKNRVAGMKTRKKKKRRSVLQVHMLMDETGMYNVASEI